VRPDLIKTGLSIPFLGPLELPAYFTAVSIGFILAIFLVWRWSRCVGIDSEGIIDLGVLMIVFGVLGARILSVIADGHFWDYVHLCTDPMKVDWPISKQACMSERYNGIWDPVLRMCHPDYRDCFSWLKFWRGGLAFYGGFIFSSIAGIIFLRLKKMPVVKVMDSAGWAIPFGLAWGRLGCFFNGCCFGAVTNSTFGVIFPPFSQASVAQAKEGLLKSPGLESLPVIPTQLIESFFSFVIAFLCYHFVERKKKFDGQTFVIFMVLYGIGRFIEEIWRMDERGEILNLSTSQFIGILCVVSGILFYILFRKRSDKHLNLTTI